MYICVLFSSVIDSLTARLFSLTNPIKGLTADVGVEGNVKGINAEMYSSL